MHTSALQIHSAAGGGFGGKQSDFRLVALPVAVAAKK